MTETSATTSVRVPHRFFASAARVYNAFLDPAQAALFLFATGTGQIVRCETDARVGGTFTIVDRRHGEDVAHTGTYVELDRPRRMVFTLAVKKYSSEVDTVAIDIAPLPRGCELTLTHAMNAKFADFRERVQEGWTEILDVASALLTDDNPTCGIGLAQHAVVPERIGTMFEGLAETLALHRTMLILDDVNARKEDEVYRELADSWSRIARLVRAAAARMAAQRDLPMGAHDATKWGADHLRAFEKYVKSESQLLALLRVSAVRDEQMLASMQKSS